MKVQITMFHDGDCWMKSENRMLISDIRNYLAGIYPEFVVYRYPANAKIKLTQCIPFQVAGKSVNVRICNPTRRCIFIFPFQPLSQQIFCYQDYANISFCARQHFTQTHKHTLAHSWCHKATLYFQKKKKQLPFKVYVLPLYRNERDKGKSYFVVVVVVCLFVWSNVFNFSLFRIISLPGKMLCTP